MYADNITKAMDETIRETNRRRKRQIEYNAEHGITPRQVEIKHNILASQLGGPPSALSGRVSAANSYDAPVYVPDPSDLGRGRVSVGLGHDSKRESGSAYVDGYISADLAAVLQDPVIRAMDRPHIEKMEQEAKRRMQKAAAELDFTAAAKYRDEMWALQQYLKVWKV